MTRITTGLLAALAIAAAFTAAVHLATMFKEIS